MLPAEPGPWHERHEQERRQIVKMEFKQFVTQLIRVPCQIVKTGRRLLYRLLSYNPWHSSLLRGVVTWRTRIQC